jgi:hypothetical protein
MNPVYLHARFRVGGLPLLTLPHTMTLDAYQKRRAECLSQLGGGGSVPKDLCRNICWNITVWLRNNEEVRARKDADRLRQGPLGWEMPLGENRFAVEYAVKVAHINLVKAFKENEVRSFQLSKDEVTMIEGCAVVSVIGHEDRKFARYPFDAKRKMWFGTHAIVLPWFSHAVIHFGGFKD